MFRLVQIRNICCTNMVLTCEGVIKSSKSVNWRAPLKPTAILFLLVLPLFNNRRPSLSNPLQSSATVASVIFVAQGLKIYLFRPGYMINLTRRRRDLCFICLYPVHYKWVSPIQCLVWGSGVFGQLTVMRVTTRKGEMSKLRGKEGL